MTDARTTGELYVALLRGINVGGNNKLPMKDLVTMLDAEGCREVVTYIQSGNAVFRATEACAFRLPTAIEKAVKSRCGFQAMVLVRTAANIQRVAQDNPFVRDGVDVGALYVMFLKDWPSADRVAALDTKRSPTDTFELRGREVYLHCPNGVGRTKLTNDYFDKTLAMTGTTRNYRTVLKLVEMTGGIDGIARR
ncbi:MAG: DUF1697 domain-containing protein [Polyangiales bacterium]